MTLLNSIYMEPGMSLFGLVVIGIWTLIWKGLALWHTGKNQQKGWFMAILVLNTLGLLPIIYLLWFKPKDIKEEKTEKKIENRRSRKR